MSELFPESGQSENVSVAPPKLQGVFLPSIDNPTKQDGFGFNVPLGGGPTARKYLEYGPTAEASSYDTFLSDFTGFGGGGGGTYNLEGLVGPQGIPGPPGPPGVSGIIGLPSINSSFLTALPDTIDQINDLGTAADKMLYTSGYTTTTNFVWAKKSVESSTKTWNESAINDDATLLLLVADNGVYVSTDGGDNWNSYDPRSEIYNQVGCADSGGKAIALGDDSRKEGVIMVTSNSGVDWVEKTVTV